MKLALYDFKSKQEFIYRTAKIKEISGASTLLSQIYDDFIRELIKNGFDISDCTAPFDINRITNDASVVYTGGGNLMMLYKDEKVLVEANKVISKYLLENIPGLNMTFCAVDVTGNFSEDRKKLFKQNVINKNQNAPDNLSTVLPFTQVDPTTFSPVVMKEKQNGEELSVSADRVAKRKAYEKTDILDSFEGLTAVIYIDGNSMGNKLMSLDSKDYNKGIAHLREFSEKVQKCFVDDPISEIKNLGVPFRKVIGGGDEITLICKAEDALDIVSTYFESLEKSECVLPDECIEGFVGTYGRDGLKNTACAGITVSHEKTPFNLVYELTEAACESAKEKAHKNPGNYFDFYYCHAGITADFDALREREQNITGKPYPVSAINSDFKKYKKLLNSAGRANVKALGIAAQLGFARYRLEVERVNSYLDRTVEEFKADENEMKTVYDLSEFFDLWFREGDNKNE